MRLTFTNQQAAFPELLARHKRLPLSVPDKANLREKTTVTNVPVPASITSLRDLSLRFLSQYEIFPRRIMQCLPEWELERRPMQVGDVILQQVFLPPFRRLSCKLVLAVRVLEVFDTDEKVGFSYGTLAGHVEQGVSAFFAELRDHEELTLNIHTFSRPGTLLSRLAGPWFTRPYQTYVTNTAMANMRAAFLRENSMASANGARPASGG